MYFKLCTYHRTVPIPEKMCRSLCCPFQPMKLQCSKFSHVRNHFVGLSLLFKKNNLLFKLLLSRKFSVSVSYKVGSYMKDYIVFSG